jgi:sugar phosphate permease
MTHPASHDRKSAGMNGVLVLLGFSIFINYIDRANLSVAAPLLRNELGLSATQLGVVLSAFFWTYACMQPIAGWLADRFDVKWVFAVGFFAWSAATALTGVIHAFAALLVMRVLLGIGESVAYPCYCKIFATHFREHQRGVANAVIGAGQALGPGLGILFRRSAGRALRVAAVLHWSGSSQPAVAGALASMDATYRRPQGGKC